MSLRLIDSLELLGVLGAASWQADQNVPPSEPAHGSVIQAAVLIARWYGCCRKILSSPAHSCNMLPCSVVQLFDCTWKRADLDTKDDS